jgi:hypothetical protein
MKYLKSDYRGVLRNNLSALYPKLLSFTIFAVGLTRLMFIRERCLLRIDVHALKTIVSAFLEFDGTKILTNKFKILRPGRK